MKNLALTLLFIPLLSACSWFGTETTNDKTAEAYTGKIYYNTEEMPDGSDTLTHLLDHLIDTKLRITDEQVSVCVYDLTNERTVYAFRAEEPIAPASTLKLLTAITALQTYGLDYSYNNEIAISGGVNGDTLMGNIILNMDADPLFEDFGSFIASIRQRGIRAVKGNIVYNLARTETLKAHPTAASWDIKYHKLPLLMKGRTFVENTFAYNLSTAGIKILKEKEYDSEVTEVLASNSHPLTDVLTPMLIHSSNIKAEAVYDAMEQERTISQHDSTAVSMVKQFCKYEMGFDTDEHNFTINDGSGLSPQNRVNTRFLVSLLRYAYDHKSVFNYLISEALPTPSGGERSGSLTTRMAGSSCVGRIFCKTGTLVTIGGSGLAGYARSADGRWLAFAILNVDCPVAEGRILQDNMCKILTRNFSTNL